MTTATTTSASLAEEVAERVRIALAAKRVTQRALCKVLDLSPPSVSRRVSGQRAFDLDEIQVVAEATGVSVVWLLTGLDTPDGGDDQSLLSDLNRRPTLYKSVALPLS